MVPNDGAATIVMVVEPVCAQDPVESPKIIITNTKIFFIIFLLFFFYR
jgi:hypothetical protein